MRPNNIRFPLALLLCCLFFQLAPSPNARGGDDSTATNPNDAQTQTGRTGTAENTQATSTTTGIGDSGKPELCYPTDSATLTKTFVKVYPNYFFRAFPVRNMVSHGSSDGNVIADQSTGDVHKLPGPYDPVPMGDDVITVPNSPMKFYSVKDVIEDKADPQPLFEDPDMTGNYQSVGILSHHGNVTRYRLTAGGNFKDYEVDTSGGKPKVTSVGTLTNMCGDLSLPMISKDGTELSGYDSTTQTTRIFKLDFANKKCTPILDLGMPTGKVDFSYDGNKLAFAAESTRGTTRTAFFTIPAANDNLNIYVYDRDRKKLSQVTHNVNSNSYYPNFKKDDSLVYINIDYGGSGQEQVSYVSANLDNTPSIPYEANCTECGQDQYNKALQAIGKLWYSVCTAGQLATDDIAQLVALNLDPEKCVDTVKNYWNQQKAQLAQPVTTALGTRDAAGRLNPADATLTENKLLAACPQAPRRQANPTIVGDGGVFAKPKNAEELMSRKCEVCHHDWPTNNPKEMLKLGVTILQRIENPDPNQRMPRGGQLNTDEIKMIRIYFEKLSQQQ